MASAACQSLGEVDLEAHFWPPTFLLPICAAVSPTCIFKPSIAIGA